MLLIGIVAIAVPGRSNSCRLVSWVMLSLLMPLGTAAAQIPGTPTWVPPGVDRTFELVFGNDFLGRGGEFDDFRTQQLGLVASVAPRWSVILDHSILTRADSMAGDPGRLDQLSASVGFRVLRVGGPRLTQDVEVGVGVRTHGEMAGAQMQNGFHRLVGAAPILVPYIDETRTDGTFWVALPHHGVFSERARVPLLGNDWTLGYWGRASSLLTTDGQWDTNLGLTAVASRRWFQVWLGVQGDLRDGYARDDVTQATAEFESGIGAVYGFRVGPLIVESSQQFGGNAAYGQARFVSAGDPLLPFLSRRSVEVTASLSVPDVYASFQGRLSNCSTGTCTGRWRRTAAVEYRFGSPQFGGDVDTYVSTWQLSATYELEAPPFVGRPWLTGFGGVGVGWRNEALERVGLSPDGLKEPPVLSRSEAVGRAGLVADLGLRFSTSATGRSVGMMIQLGLSGWLPTSGADVEFEGSTERLQRPSVVVVPGLLVRVSLGPAQQG